MKRLFLASVFAKSVGKFINAFSDSLQKINVAFIPTAADSYADKWFVKDDREALLAEGYKVTDIDIKGKTKERLEEELKPADIIFVAGGNVFYLLEKTRESGFDEVVTELVESGVIYAGSSAGAVLVCPDVAPVGPLDDPSKAPNLKSTKGLGLVDFVILPHWGKEKYKKQYEEVMKKYGKSGYKLIPITDQQAVVVKGNKYTIV